MRKTIKKAVVTVVLASTVIGLTGCGSSGVFSSSLNGGKSSSKVTYDGNLIDADVLSKTSKIETITEKLVSGEYNSDVFVFGNSDIRKLLADIQIEEQNHAEMLWKYKTANGMA